MEAEKTNDGWINCAVSLPLYGKMVDAMNLDERKVRNAVMAQDHGLVIEGVSVVDSQMNASRWQWREQPDYHHSGLEDDEYIVPSRPLVVPEDHANTPIQYEEEYSWRNIPEVGHIDPSWGLILLRNKDTGREAFGEVDWFGNVNWTNKSIGGDLSQLEWRPLPHEKANITRMQPEQQETSPMDTKTPEGYLATHIAGEDWTPLDCPVKMQPDIPVLIQFKVPGGHDEAIYEGEFSKYGVLFVKIAGRLSPAYAFSEGSFIQWKRKPAAEESKVEYTPKNWTSLTDSSPDAGAKIWLRNKKDKTVTNGKFSRKRGIVVNKQEHWSAFADFREDLEWMVR